MENKSITPENYIDSFSPHICLLEKGHSVKMVYDSKFVSILQIILAQKFYACKTEIRIIGKIMTIIPLEKYGKRKIIGE